MEEINLIKEFFGLGGAISFAIVFGVVVAVRKTSIDDLRDRLVRVENDLQWIKKALGDKDSE